MKCDEFDERVHSLLDNREPIHGDRRLLEHAEACSKCRGMLGAYDDLFGGLKCGGLPDLSANFTQRVLAQVSAESPQTVQPARHTRRRYALAAVAIAAGLLVALSPFLRNWLTPKRPIGPQVVEDNREEQPEPPAPKPTDGDSSHDDDAVQLANDAVVGDRNEDADGEQLPNLLDRLAAPSLPLDRFVPVDEIRGGLRPVTSSLTVAIDALRSTIPIGRHDRSQDPADHSPSAQFAPHDFTSV